MSILIETSCLLRLSDPADLRHLQTQAALDQFTDQNEDLVIISQNLVEFRAVATRPLAVNGLGLRLVEVELASAVAQALPRGGCFRQAGSRHADFHDTRIFTTRGFSRHADFHDTRIAAACAAAGISTILTWNPGDFRRFLPFVPGLSVVTPEEAVLQT